MKKTRDINVVALDLGSACGWAAIKNGLVSSGAWKNPARYADSPGAFFSNFRLWLADLKQWHAPQIVAYEMTHPGRGQHQGLISYGMITRVQEWAYRNDAREVFVFSSTLKKYATGNGRAEKPEMIEAMRKAWGLPKLSNDHEADALAVLAYAVETHKGQSK